MIKIGVIGTGGMGNWHADAYSKISDVKIVACSDVVEENRKKFAEKWKVSNVYSDYNEMFKKEKLDGVSNVTPDGIHKDVAIAALKNGVPILSEKPLAKNLADAKKMYQLAKKSKVINMVNFSYRKSSGLQEAAKAIAMGKIGRIIHVEASYLQSWLSSKYWGDWSKETTWLWRLSTKHGFCFLWKSWQRT